MLRIGIVGLAQAGKTTLFKILTRARGAGVASGRPETRLGVVSVPDERLDRLAALYRPRNTVRASVEYTDTPGSVIGLARSGIEAASLREVAALAHVVRAFGEAGGLSAQLLERLRSDIENVELEFVLSDLATVEKRLERLEKDLKKQKSPQLETELLALEKCKAILDRQTPLREVTWEPSEERAIRGFTFLSIKPALFILNLDEKDAARTDEAKELAAALGLARKPKTEVTAICGQVEAELAELSDAEAESFLASFGFEESAINRLIRTSFHLLGLISFFTVGEDECRAWTLSSGATAWEAAGEIHSDIQRGFIRAEVVKVADLLEAGSLAEARNRERLRVEGKDYVVEDGEVVHIRHSS